MAQKETSFTLAGQTYKLKFSMRVPLYWEQASRKNYFEAFGPQAKPSLTDILTLVWAAFKNGGCKLTLDELADKLSDRDLQELSASVMKLAADNSAPAPEGDNAPLAAPPQA